ncbi:hypothetical protein SAMN05192549_106404 [Duganella sacchari]|uniref:2OG-Fe(II) oxygenase superfamily protein n=1 Tax=Duganella sacchari TaxID=551987 RepID=A0A1M7Q9N7_9BURK|nr:DUF6445 family protein [Duganella sacchari]SHN27393.1 hypothetical protein SAMN05192549_106404 [Duganella sacchari]
MARPALTYRKPQLGRDYWVLDGVLPNAAEVAQRCFAREAWELGAPHRAEPWPGMRSQGALLPDELAQVEAWVRKVTGAKKLWQQATPQGSTLNHNYVQLVGGIESGPRPHTDSLKLCRYAAVIYLSPEPMAAAGTSFYRLRYPDGTLGGNYCSPPHANLREALGVTSLPPQAWHEELRVENRFNRMLLYRANLVHSASSYFGCDHHDKRMTAVFFWMA